MSKSRAATLIELTVFITILSIVSLSLISVYAIATELSMKNRFAVQATSLAQGRLDIILGQKDVHGFDALADPCEGGMPPSVCTVHSDFDGFNIASTISLWNSKTDVKEIAVTVSGKGEATLSTLVTDS